jgi:hypothetical protein
MAWKVWLGRGLACAALCGCAPEEDEVIPPFPLEEPTAPEPEEEAASLPVRRARAKEVEPGRLTVADFEDLLPPLGRDGRHEWGKTSALVPGHYAARLWLKDANKPLLTLSVDDLKGQDARLVALKNAPERVGGYPAELAPGAWMRVLVYERYEVALYAEHDSTRDAAELRRWYDKVKRKKLEEKPPAPPSGAPPSGAPTNGAPTNGAPPSGVPANGVPANGVPASGGAR